MHVHWLSLIRILSMDMTIKRPRKQYGSELLPIVQTLTPTGNQQCGIFWGFPQPQHCLGITKNTNKNGYRDEEWADAHYMG